MPLTHFICPDNNTVKLQDCLTKCRLGKRCLTKPTLTQLAKVRVWKGVPSTTQLLNGTRQTFLQITKDFAERPHDMGFRLLGTTVHGGLETDQDDALIEETITSKDGISGTADILETEDDWNILTDYKTSGSYKVCKALGMYQIYEDSETEVYQKKTHITVNGEKITRLAGDPKIIKKWKSDIQKQDCMDWVLQLNKYRIAFEEQGFRVDELRVQSIIRDGGLSVARSRGLDGGIYLIPIPILPNDEVLKFFNDKKVELEQALKDGYCTKCTPEERWDGMKCDNFCPVRQFCDEMGD